jgi:hypothetical protein
MVLNIFVIRKVLIKWHWDEPINVIMHIYVEMSQGNLCIAILNKQKWRTRKQDSSCLGTSGREEDTRKGCRSDYGANTVYTCLWMEKWDLLKLFWQWGKRIGQNGEGVNSTMMYNKNFCECHIILPVQDNKKRRKEMTLRANFTQSEWLSLRKEKRANVDEDAGQKSNLNTLLVNAP